MSIEKQQLFKSRLDEILANPDTIKFYTKSNCRHCYGRGYITRISSRIKDKITGQVINYGERNELCDCVYKKIRAEIEESLKDG